MNSKSLVITFKADRSLAAAIRGMENRSKFIREAVFAALENVCPVCKGSGILTVNQMRHWDRFAEDHRLRECTGCHEEHLVCAHEPRKRTAHKRHE
ncbi:MAG TPA: hypothetical protein VN285_01955 [Candidatus Deferrimicrobium sp.]|nr:hypothetical protein [Candidatus Deferrimicrobium sp.]